MGFFDFPTIFIFVVLRNCDVIVIILSSYTNLILLINNINQKPLVYSL